jgi:diguanylate cyclase (GGDEF)-like protein
MMADLDNFKLVNDQLGHGQGDEALRRYFSVLRDLASANGGDAYRRGGDETVTLLPGAEGTGPRSLGDSLREGVKGELAGFSRRIGRPLTVSVGVVAVGERSEVSAVLDLADRLLYQAKEGGRDCVVTEALPNTGADTG